MWELRKQLYLKDALRPTGGAAREKLLSLYRNIAALTPEDGGRTVLLTGVDGARDAALLTCELAKTVALTFEQRVLLLDATPQASRLARFQVFPNYSWSKAYRDDKPVADAIYQLGDSSLFVSQIARDEDALGDVVDAPQTAPNLARLKQLFGLTVIAADGAGVALAGRADGVIIVIEAEKTRWQTAARRVDDIRNLGGTVLGTLLSNRSAPIPQFIYDRL